MYRKLRTHDGIVLSPVLRQMDTLSDALHRGNPAMLAVNTAIATASEQSYHLTKLHTAGPVSYTHLDVYKRQVLGILVVLIKS